MNAMPPRQRARIVLQLQIMLRELSYAGLSVSAKEDTAVIDMEDKCLRHI